MTDSTQNKQVRTRFAPSPTGFVHVGNFRTALFAFLYARHFNGVNILRIEDTDQTRKTDGAVENLLAVMSKMGVSFDEGAYLENYDGVNFDSATIKFKGDVGPYVQSERLGMYQSHAKQLVEQGKAYYCFCSQERLDELRKEQVALKKPPMYDRHCKKLSAEEVTAKLQENPNAVIRQANPDQGQTVIHDLVYGDIAYEHNLLDDQVLLKSDGFPTYHLAVVIDDHYMEITHVIRAEEWIPSTPKHLLLYQAFGWTPPAFAHLPLILNPDKTKLSKRQGDVSVEDFLQKGYLPEALVNFVALLGWNPKTEQEIFSMDGLIEAFDLAKVNKAGAVFDVNKLDWMNASYIKEKSNQELLQLVEPWLKPFLAEQGIELSSFPSEFLLAMINIEKERLKTLSQITENTDFYFVDAPKFDSEDSTPEMLIWKKADKADAVQKLSSLVEFLSNLPDSDLASTSILEEKVKAWISEQGYETGNVLWPMRVALTGLAKSPSPFEVASCLSLNGGKDAVIKRLNKAINLLS